MVITKYSLVIGQKSGLTEMGKYVTNINILFRNSHR
jgi:hypothetical protein